MARGSIAPESFIFAKDYHHSQMFSCEFGKVNNSQKFSFADYSHYMVVQFFCSKTTYFRIVQVFKHIVVEI